jgi:hypothetical protein
VRPAEPPTIAVERVAAQPIGVLDAGESVVVSQLSYEQALALAKPVTSDEPDLTNAQLHAPMANASFVNGCAAPEDMKVSVRVVVHRGRALGATVTTNPADATVAACVDRHVRLLTWPRNDHFDSFTTVY